MEEDKFKQFENEGVVFKAKLIGSELVMEPRGETMCQNSIQRLKAIIKGQKAHKKRIVMKVSYAGVKVFDEKSNELLYQHEVPQISFISSDDTDSRTFGYVCDVPNKAHQFICFKTSGPALQVITVISSLFEAVLDKKKRLEGGAGAADDISSHVGASNVPLNGESSIVSADKSAKSDKENENNNSDSATNKNNLFDDFDDDKFSQLIINEKVSSSTPTPAGAATSATQASRELPAATNQSEQLTQTAAPVTATSDGAQQLNRQTSLQQTLSFSSPVDLIDGGDSGIIESPSTTFSANDSSWLPPPPVPTSTSSSSTALAPPPQQQSHAQAVDSIRNQQQQYQLMQSNPIAISERTMAGDSLFDQGFSTSLSSRPSTSVRGQANPATGTPPRHSYMHHLHRLPGGTQHKSLVYNHSSASLNDAALSNNRSTFVPVPSGGATVNESGTDRYAVFNDIDNLPSIFESTSSLGSKNNLSSVGQVPPGATGPQTSATAQLPATDASNALQFAGGTSDPFSDIGPQLGGKPSPQQLISGHDHKARGPRGGYSFDSSSSSHLIAGNQTATTMAAEAAHRVFSSSAASQSLHQPPLQVGSSAGSLIFGLDQQPQAQPPQQYHYHQQPQHQPLQDNQTQYAAQMGAVPFAVNRFAAAPTPSVSVPVNPATSSSLAFGPQPSGGGMIVGSAPMAGHQMNAHARFSSSMVGSIHQRLGSSAASVGSTGGLSRQTNPFDDDFFS